MVIRKLFTFQGAHIVRDCSSDRCKKSIHGHSYIVEVFLESNSVDNGQMVVDFGLLKGNVKDLIDAFDHAYSMWNRETDEYKGFMKSNSERWIEMPVSPSAEMYSLMLYAVIKEVLDKTEWANGETGVKLYKVRVHETATGYAESYESDYYNIWKPNYKLDQIVFSKGIKDEWKDGLLWDKVLDPNHTFKNTPVELKYQGNYQRK